MNEKLLYLLEDEKELKDFGAKTAKFVSDFEKVAFDPSVGDPEVKVPVEMSYVCVLLDVLDTTAEDKNAAAESRC